jgi:1,4-alpha-glucan branching enzyme
VTSPSPQKSAVRPSGADKIAIEAIAGGYHGDPFAILGPHQTGPGEWEIRAMLPEASRAAIYSADEREMYARMESVHPAGFYVARLQTSGRPHYKIGVETAHGLAFREDPYRFPLALSDKELRTATAIGSAEPYRVFGAHEVAIESVAGCRFAVWAPNAQRVSVVGDFNGWDGRRHPMRLRPEAGVWELFIPDCPLGQRYKFEIRMPQGTLLPLKSDPYAFAAEIPPATASIIHDVPDFAEAAAPGAGRFHTDPRKEPIAIYECHLGSWMRVPEENNRYLTYRELAERLIPYVAELGFTHIELMPIAEHPFDGSWGYQPVSLFAPTSRFGPPEDFGAFVDAAHRAGLGVLLDWVPGHFPQDPHGLKEFDGTHLYEHADPRQGIHLDWGTAIYNFGRSEVATFLIANARFWLEEYRLDGLRVDAVASMLYLDYSRQPGQWIPNRHGGNENLEAIAFLQEMNRAVYSNAPGIITAAEESTAWGGVTIPPESGGLGFGFKWNMGWMNDTLRYVSFDPIHRRYHHNDLTFGLLYAFSENFILPLSHDEVVHGKRSLLGRMPGDRWQRFANLRAYFGFMWGHPGKKLLFMGGEFGQENEWDHDHSLDWHLLEEPEHAGVKALVADLNRIYRALPALHRLDCEAAGFEWLIGDDADNSVLAFARHGDNERELAIVVCNFTPVPREKYRVGVPARGSYREAVNTDAKQYGGSDMRNGGAIKAEPIASHGRKQSIEVTVPPLATVILEFVG